jgi:hypothetical protein
MVPRPEHVEECLWKLVPASGTFHSNGENIFRNSLEIKRRFWITPKESVYTGGSTMKSRKMLDATSTGSSANWTDGSMAHPGPKT